jgi:hypothetical protein
MERSSRRRVGRLVGVLGLLLGLGLTAAACGGEGGADARAAESVARPSAATTDAAPPDAFALDRALLEADQRVSRTARPLLDCLDDPGCEVLSMPQEAKRLATAIDDEIDGLEIALALDPNGCAKEAAEAALRAYGTLRGVAQASDEPHAYRALARAFEQRVDVSYGLAGCSPFRGHDARFFEASQVELANAERRTMFRVGRCRSAACLRRESAALARTTAGALGELRPHVDEVQDRCARELSRLNLTRIGGYRQLGAAGTRNDDVAWRRADQAIVDADAAFARTYLRCLDEPSLGARAGTS